MNSIQCSTFGWGIPNGTETVNGLEDRQENESQRSRLPSYYHLSLSLCWLDAQTDINSSRNNTSTLLPPPPLAIKLISTSVKANEDGLTKKRGNPLQLTGWVSWSSVLQQQNLVDFVHE